MSEPKTTPPCVVSAPYRLSAWQIVGATTARRGALILAVFGYVGYLSLGLPGAIVVPAVLAVFMVVATLRNYENAECDRYFEAWPDGSYRCTLPTAVVDCDLNAAIDVRGTRLYWRIKLDTNLFHLVPKAALDADSSEHMERLVANRRSPKKRLTTCPADPLMTLPFDPPTGLIVRRRLPRLAVCWLTPLAFVSCAQGGLLPNTTPGRPLIDSVFEIAAVFVILAPLYALLLEQEHRKPIYRGRRIVILPDGLEVFGRVLSGKVHRSQLTKVVPKQDHIFVQTHQEILIPATAFRDADHRRTFEDALVALSNRPDGASTDTSS